MSNEITLIPRMVEGGEYIVDQGMTVPGLRFTGQDGEVVNVLLGTAAAEQLRHLVRSMLNEDDGVESH